MSSSESKKKSHSKKDHQEDEKPIEEIHTVNNWEAVDLGDDQRKAKFLRLMGAKKRSKDESGTDRQNSSGSNHEDDVVPEKKHCRSQTETEIINRELEKQFNEGLQTKIQHMHHGGLGFHGESSNTSSSGDWKHQSTKATFVPAKTEVGSAMDHVKVDQTEETEEKSSDKQSKKKSSDNQDKEKSSDQHEKEKSSDKQEKDKSSDKQEKKKKSKSNC